MCKKHSAPKSLKTLSHCDINLYIETYLRQVSMLFFLSKKKILISFLLSPIVNRGRYGYEYNPLHRAWKIGEFT